MLQNMVVVQDGATYRVLAELTREVLFASDGASAAVQAAIDALAATGGVVSLGRGTFRVAEPIRLADQVSLRGSGRGTRLIVDPANAEGIGLRGQGVSGAVVADLAVVDEAQRARMWSGRKASFAAMGELRVWYARADLDDLRPLLARQLGKARHKRVARAADQARSRDSLHAVGKLTTVVDGRRRIAADPPLIVPITDLLPDLSTGVVAVAGRRIEATIPAGAVGNSKPIQMSAEQWYGKDLQVVIEATYRDPRTGETRYRLSDIERAEPDAALFQVPDTYRKQQPPHPRGR